MLLVTAVIMTVIVYTGKHGVRKDGLCYAASGIHPDCQIVTINGTPVSAEEYLYLVSYDCQYLSQYVSNIDWNAEVSDGMTYGSYVKTDALETAKLYTILRQWASKNGITLTDADKAAMAAERAQYVTYYGSEEAYANMIKLVGISEATYKDTSSVYYLYSHIYEQFCDPGSKLYPGADVLSSYGADGSYATIKEIFLSTTGLTDEEKAAKQAQAQAIAEELKAASDISAAFDTLSSVSEDSVAQKNPNGVTFAAGSLGNQVLEDAVASLGEKQVSVVESSGGYYVVVRLPLDASGLLESYFSKELADARSSAAVTYSKEYNNLDVGSFYTALTQKRTDLSSQLSSAASSSGGSSSNAAG